MNSHTNANKRYFRLVALAAIYAGFFLSSCSSGFNRFTDVYLHGMQSDMQYMGGSYKISDRFDIGGLYVRPDFGTAFDEGTAMATATDGEKDYRITIRSVAINYLKNQGRNNCTVDKGTEVMTGQFEFKYKCGKQQ